MIYWLVLPTNRPRHLEPVWKLLYDWLPHLRENAAPLMKGKLAHRVGRKSAAPILMKTTLLATVLQLAVSSGV